MAGDREHFVEGTRGLVYKPELGLVVLGYYRLEWGSLLEDGRERVAYILNWGKRVLGN